MQDKHNNAAERSPKDAALFLGLGNPGDAYARTYHNAGALAVEFLADGLEFSVAPQKTFAYAKRGGKIFAKTLVYMNESGVAARDALRHFGLPPEKLAVLHDDADIAVGAHKTQFGRGAAGHHGVESVAKLLGTKDFWRVRVGIEQRTLVTGKRKRAETYVLKPVSLLDRGPMKKTFEAVKTETGA